MLSPASAFQPMNKKTDFYPFCMSQCMSQCVFHVFRLQPVRGRRCVGDVLNAPILPIIKLHRIENGPRQLAIMPRPTMA